METKVDQNEDNDQATKFLGVYLVDKRSEEKENSKESAVVYQNIKDFWS